MTRSSQKLEELRSPLGAVSPDGMSSLDNKNTSAAICNYGRLGSCFSLTTRSGRPRRLTNTFTLPPSTVRCLSACCASARQDVRPRVPSHSAFRLTGNSSSLPCHMLPAQSHTSLLLVLLASISPSCHHSANDDHPASAGRRRPMRPTR